MNPMPVVTDKVLFTSELYSIPVLLLVLSSCETGEILQASDLERCDIPIFCTRCSPPRTRGGFLYSAAFPHLLAGLENDKLTPCKYILRLAQLIH
jgi:hypothetical protein